MSKDRIERARMRTTPYTPTPRRPLHPTVPTATFNGTKVKEVPSMFDRAKQVSYGLFKASPFVAAVFPNPITCGIAVASAAESLYHARKGGIADKLEAFALLGGSISGAAALTYTNIGNDRILTDEYDTLDCRSTTAFRAYGQKTVYFYDGSSGPRWVYCDLANGQAKFIQELRYLPSSTPVIILDNIETECRKAKFACNNPPPIALAPTTSEIIAATDSADG